MAAKNKVTVSTQPTTRRGTTAERRAEHIASLSTKQADLKREAAERRAQRAENPPPVSTPRKKHAVRRSTAG